MIKFTTYPIQPLEKRSLDNSRPTTLDEMVAALNSKPAVVASAQSLKPYASEQFCGMFDYHDLYDYIVDQAPDGSTIVELGVWCGKSLGYLGERAAKSGKKLRIIGYDFFAASILQWHPDGPKTGLQDRVKSDDDWASEVRLRMHSILPENPPEVMRSYSADAARLHDDQSVWAVFVDADHSADSVYADVQAWLPKLKVGGLLAGHDFSFDSVRQGLARAGLNVMPVSQDSWITRTWPEQPVKSNTTADNMLHVLIACTRPEGVVKILEATYKFPQVMLHVYSDAARQHYGGHVAKNKILDSIANGWVWICDDDNLPHESFLCDILAKITNAPTDIRGFIVSQSWEHTLLAAQSPRVGSIDTAQLVARRSTIADIRMPIHHGGDGDFIRAVWDGGGIELLPDVIVGYNAQSSKCPHIAKSVTGTLT